MDISYHFDDLKDLINKSKNHNYNFYELFSFKVIYFISLITKVLRHIVINSNILKVKIKITMVEKMDSNNIDDRINLMKSQKLKAKELEAENKKKSENYKKERQIEFNETFGIFFDFIENCKNKKNDLLELFIHNRTKEPYKNNTNEIRAKYNYIDINVIPSNIGIIESSQSDNQILLGICFEPVNSFESINDITWYIGKQKLCNFIVKSHIPLKTDSFYIPSKIFCKKIKYNKIQVRTDIVPIKFSKYHYIIKINFKENKYIFSNLSDCSLTFNNEKSCCLDIYNSKLEVSIDKNVLLDNRTIIENDLYNILTNDISKNEFLTYKEKNKLEVLYRPFDLDNGYWNKPYSFINDNFIIDYPKYMASIIQYSENIKELNKSCFEYIC